MKRVPTDHCSIERLRREKTNPLKKSWIREFYAFGNTHLLEIRIIRKNCKNRLANSFLEQPEILMGTPAEQNLVLILQKE